MKTLNCLPSKCFFFKKKCLNQVPVVNVQACSSCRASEQCPLGQSLFLTWKVDDPSNDVVHVLHSLQVPAVPDAADGQVSPGHDAVSTSGSVLEQVDNPDPATGLTQYRTLFLEPPEPHDCEHEDHADHVVVYGYTEHESKELIDGKNVDNYCKMDLQLVQSSRPQNLFC